MSDELGLSNLEKIDYVVEKTIKYHDNFSSSDVIRAMANLDDFTNYITARDYARDVSSTLTKEQVIEEIIKFVIRFSGTFYGNKYSNYCKKCTDFFHSLNIKDIKGNEVVDYLLKNKNVLDDLCQIFADLRYDKMSLQEIETVDNVQSSYIEKYLRKLTEKESSKKKRNIRIFKNTITKCQFDILTGFQLKKKENEYKVGNSLFAKTMIGDGKIKKDDSVLLIEHPTNKKFKLLMVADGAVGQKKGGKASNYTAKRVMSWFKKLSPVYYTDLDRLSYKLDSLLTDINSELLDERDGRATTFLCGIVGRDETLVKSSGNSRAYVTRGDDLIQVTRDDSVVQDYYEKGKITKDDMKFHVEAQYLTQYLGMDERKLCFDTCILRNDGYDSLILVSDGISGYLSDDKIREISTRTPRDKIAKELVEEADVGVSSRKNNFDKESYYDNLFGGRDNETAAVYTRKIRRRNYR